MWTNIRTNYFLKLVCSDADVTMEKEQLAASIQKLDAVITKLKIRLNVLELQFNVDRKPSWIGGILSHYVVYYITRLLAIAAVCYIVWRITVEIKEYKICATKKKKSDLLNSASVLCREHVLNIRQVGATWNINVAAYKPFIFKFSLSDYSSYSKKDMYIIVSLIQINMTHEDVQRNTEDVEELRRICNVHQTKKFKKYSNDVRAIAKLGEKYGIIYSYQSESVIVSPSSKTLKTCNYIDVPNASPSSLVLLTIVNVTGKHQKRIVGQCIVPSKLIFSNVERSNSSGNKINALLTPTKRHSRDNLTQHISPKFSFSPEAISATESVANSIKERQAKLKEQEHEQNISTETKTSSKSGMFSVSLPLESACIPYLGMPRTDQIEKNVSLITIYLSFARHSFHWITDASSSIEVTTEGSGSINIANSPSRHYIRTKSKHIFNCPAFGSQLKYLFAAGPIDMTTTLEVNAWIDGYLFATKQDDENVFIAVNCSIGYCQPIIAGNNDVSNYAKSTSHVIKTSTIIGLFYFMFATDNDEYSDYDFAIEIQYLSDVRSDDVQRFVIYPNNEFIWKHWIRLFALCSNLTKSVELHVNDSIIDGPHKLTMPHLLNYLPLVSVSRPLTVVCVSRLPVTILQCVKVDDFFHPDSQAADYMGNEVLNSDDLIPRFVDMYNHLDIEENDADQYDVNSTNVTPKTLRYPKEARDDLGGWNGFIKSIGSIFS